MSNSRIKKVGRGDERLLDQLRGVRITPNVVEWAEGSALVEFGKTRVLCTASVDEKVPPYRAGKGIGWVTAEYSMLPRATHSRTPREAAVGKVSGRTQEIQRLIGRSLRGIVNFVSLGERQIIVDCDVLQADGGTRTASITGGYVALALACKWLQKKGLIDTFPLTNAIAAVSVGIVQGQHVLDLNYSEDSAAAVDFNVVMLDSGEFVEVQGTAEGSPFSRNDIDAMLSLAEKGIRELFEIQKQAISEA
ncbi:ribonuclease PH [Candidatus Chlorohelix allophototropha]|uniref:Ribonuclease PH n=1 Tax=Candidatus Chlorohelix allophototropha TaxID=3003348 RepID=A0ABY9B4I5_9CHLR|nr:ribonuclease PH [Chloroflexota bacterium L227-S17]